MSLWLADTGPLVAVLAANDGMHPWAVEQLKHAPATLVTCEAVVTEALFLIRRAGFDPDKMFELLASGFLRTDFSFGPEHAAIRKLMHRYASLPMSFADACLVRMTEKHPGSAVWTVDRDFHVYRQHGRQTIPLISPF